MGVAWKEHKQTAHSLLWVSTYSRWEVWDRWDDLVATWHLKAVKGNLEIKISLSSPQPKTNPKRSWNVDLETMGNTHWSKGRHFVKRKVEVRW
jgi:hypothetical protein